VGVPLVVAIPDVSEPGRLAVETNRVDPVAVPVTHHRDVPGVAVVEGVDVAFFIHQVPLTGGRVEHANGGRDPVGGDHGDVQRFGLETVVVEGHNFKVVAGCGGQTGHHRHSGASAEGGEQHTI